MTEQTPSPTPTTYTWLTYVVSIAAISIWVVIISIVGASYWYWKITTATTPVTPVTLPNVLPEKPTTPDTDALFTAYQQLEQELSETQVLNQELQLQLDALHAASHTTTASDTPSTETIPNTVQIGTDTMMHSIQTQQRSLMLLFATQQLHNALQYGKSFTAALAQITSLLPQESSASPLVQEALNTLEHYQEGIKTKQKLVQHFPLIAEEIKHIAYKENSSFFSFFTHLVRIRKLDDTGMLNSEDILYQAQRFLRQGELTKALEVMQQLEEEPAVIASEWVEDTQAFLAASQAATTLQQYISTHATLLQQE